VAGLGATFAISGTKASGKILGANDTIRIAIAGIHGQGAYHLKSFAPMKGVDVTCLVDPDSRLFDSRVSKVEELGGNTPKCVRDIREVLDDKEIDAISIATPNHWHSLMAIWACQAGKHVYVEKPCSHNVSEGRKLVEAAAKYNQLVQHGTQQRSNPRRAAMIAAIHSGQYGKLLVAKGYCCKPRWSIGFKEPKSPPAELDFNLWLGPIAEQPYHENLVHYNWHWFWDTGNGDMGNQGVHEIDVARWAIQGATLPKSVWSLGGRWVETDDYKDQGETPNMIMSVFDYGDVLLVFETRGLVGKKTAENAKEFPFKVGNEFFTTEGKIVGDMFYPAGGGAPEKLAPQDVNITPGDRFGSFIHALRSGRQEDINSPILEGHYSAALCHLGNISYRLGKPVPFGQKPDTLGDNRQTVESYEAILENLEGVGVKTDELTYCLGPTLKFDPQSEKFVDNDEANQRLTRAYREPFVVPDSV
jgi:predicted dehydrogenase